MARSHASKSIKDGITGAPAFNSFSVLARAALPSLRIIGETNVITLQPKAAG
jgi:hypothetical protein